MGYPSGNAAQRSTVGMNRPNNYIHNNGLLLETHIANIKFLLQIFEKKGPMAAQLSHSLQHNLFSSILLTARPSSSRLA